MFVELNFKQFESTIDEKHRSYRLCQRELLISLLKFSNPKLYRSKTSIKSFELALILFHGLVYSKSLLGMESKLT